MEDKYILLIEDSEPIRKSLIWTFEFEGYLIRTASNGKEAFDLLEKHSLPFIILLDMMMPVMDGWQFREKQQLHPQLKEIPTIILTARINLNKDIQLSRNEKFVSKPFDLNELLKTIQEAAHSPVLQ